MQPQMINAVTKKAAITSYILTKYHQEFPHSSGRFYYQAFVASITSFVYNLELHILSMSQEIYHETMQVVTNSLLIQS